MVSKSEIPICIVPLSAHFLIRSHVTRRPWPYITFSQATQEYKVVLLGDGGVGKTTLIKRLLGVNSAQYYCTMGYEIHHLVLNTNRGAVKFEVWDTSGQEKPGELRQHYYENSHGAIFMFGYNSRITFNSVTRWHRDIKQNNGDIPFALIATFADEEPRKIKERDITRFRNKDMYRRTMLNEPFQMSTPTDSFAVLARPFLRLAERLMGMESETLHLV